MVIEKDIPIPEKNSRSRYASIVMAWGVNDSVLCETEAQGSCLRSAAINRGQKVKTRKVEGGWRLWRVA